MDVFLTGFSKKLLVAISVVVILAMCLRPAEAASIEHTRHRAHGRLTKPTKDTARPETMSEKSHKRRHHGCQVKNGPLTKELNCAQKTNDVRTVECAHQNIAKMVFFTKHMFEDRRKNLSHPDDYGSGRPAWLPKTNFVEIHAHNCNISNGSSRNLAKRIFSFLAKKLYISLYKYYKLFEIFQRVEVESLDTQIDSYNFKRQDFFVNTTNDLNNIIRTIKEAMESVNMSVPKTSWSQTLDMKVNAAQYLKNDDILLKTYGKFLSKWEQEFKCSNCMISKNMKRGKKCNPSPKNLKGKSNCNCCCKNVKCGTKGKSRRLRSKTVK